jgi:DNA polymerase-4
VGKKTEQTLKQMGISTIGELASLPPEAVKEHFGKFGIAVNRHARGIDERRVEAPGEPKSISQEVTFARDTLDRHFLEANLRHMCQEVGAELRSRHRQASCVALKLRYADFTTITRQTALKAAANSDQAIFATVSQLLDRVLAQNGRLVRLIGIKVSNLAGREKQLDMFDYEAKRAENLNRAVEQIRRKYGQAAIKTGGS